MNETKYYLVPWPDPDNPLLPCTPLSYPSPDSSPPALLGVTLAKNSWYFITGVLVWGVEPGVTHRTSWLEGTGMCGVQQYLAGEKDCSLVQSRVTYCVCLT